MFIIEYHSVECEINKKKLCFCWNITENKGKNIEFGIQYLSSKELQYMERIIPQKRKQEFCMGRLLSKLAAVEAGFIDRYELASISILKSIYGYPILKDSSYGFDVNITHSNHSFASIVYPNEIQMSIDLEEINDEKGSLQLVMNGKESLLKPPGMSDKTFYKLLWTCKEALGKCLRLGISSGIDSYSVSKITIMSRGVLSKFLYFPQFIAFSRITKERIITVILPSNIEIKRFGIKEKAYEL